MTQNYNYQDGSHGYKFQLEIKHKPRVENLVVDHLDWLENGESGTPSIDCFPYKNLYVVIDRSPWYVDC